MAVSSLILDEFNRTILIPIFTSVLNDINKAILIPYGNMTVLHRESDLTKTCGMSNVSGLSEDNLPKTISERRLFIRINDDYNEDSITSTAIHQQSAYPIFKDNDINVFISPIYIRTNVEIQFTYISPSRIEADKIRDDIRLRLSQARNILHHEFEYDIIIPTEIEEFIEHVHELKSRLIPQPLDEYFLANSTKRIHLLTDMANEHNVRLAIKERQVRVTGVFDFVMPEKLEVDEENNNYKLNFSYKLSFDSPKAMVVHYPVMIANRPLKRQYLQPIIDSKELSLEERKKELRYSKGLFALSHFEAHRQLENRVDINLPINIPIFDDFHEKVLHKGYTVITSFLVEVNETDKRTVLNLNDLGNYEIDRKVLEYIRLHRNKVVNPYMSFIYIGLFQEESFNDLNVLEILPDLTVRSKVNIPLLKPTRVLLSIAVDIDMLETTHLQELYRTPEVFFTILNEYMYAVVNNKIIYDITSPNDQNTLRYFILALNYFIQQDQRVNVVRLLTIFGKDNHTLVTFLSYIRNNFKTTYEYILQENILPLTEVILNVGINNLNDIPNNLSSIQPPSPITITEETLNTYLNEKGFTRYTQSTNKNTLRNKITESKLLYDFLSESNFNMKSLMTSYIVAKRKTDLGV